MGVDGWCISPRPARLAVVNARGELLSSGVVRGNDRGLPDPQDVAPALERCRTGDARCDLVLGDSFSAAQ